MNGIEEQQKKATHLLLLIRDQLDRYQENQKKFLRKRHYDEEKEEIFGSSFIEGENEVEEDDLLLGRIGSNLNDLGRITSSMESLTKRQPSSKKEIWKIRTSSLNAERRTLDGEYTSFLRNNERIKNERIEKRERMLLLGSGDEIRKKGEMMKEILNEGESIDRSINMARDMEESGIATLAELQSQHSTVQGINKKLRDVASGLGVSSSLINVIQRRLKTDKYLVYGGMIFTLVLIFVLYYYTRRSRG